MQYSVGANLKVILCEILSRYVPAPGLTEEKMAANIYRTFCFTDSSLLESFTQEFRSQLSQVSAWDFFLMSVSSCVSSHTSARCFGGTACPHLAQNSSSLYWSTYSTWRWTGLAQTHRSLGKAKRASYQIVAIKSSSLCREVLFLAFIASFSDK